MQIVILSMHRSGSSVMARLLNMMGAYFAPEGMALAINPNNPKGFWERQDVVDLNDKLLRSAGLEWDRASSFQLSSVPAEIASECEKEARQILASLDSFRPWMVKDPRLCLTFDFWRPLLEMPVCVICSRKPLEVARSLLKRNSMPIAVGLALWEYYTIRSLHSSSGLPRVIVCHRELMTKPMDVLEALRGRLEEHGVHGLRLPAKSEVERYLEPGLIHHVSKDAEQDDYLTRSQRELHAFLEQDNEPSADWQIQVSESAMQVLQFYEDYLALQKAHKELKQDALNAAAKKRELHEKLQARERRFQELRGELSISDAKLRELDREHKIAARRNDELSAKCSQVSVKCTEMEVMLRCERERSAKALDAERRAQDLSGRLSEVQRINRSLQRDVVKKGVEIDRLSKLVAEERSSKEHLKGRIEELFSYVGFVFNSCRWRLGDRIAGSLERLRFKEKPEAPLADKVKRLEQEYQAWLKITQADTTPAVSVEEAEVQDAADLASSFNP